MKIIVNSGNIGTPVAVELAKAGAQVTLTVRTPKNAAGTLRLYCIDVDGMGGGRKLEVFVNGTSVAVLENVGAGRWVEVPIAPEVNADGKIDLRIENRVPGANAVISLLEWRD